jgi:hypothetical protein
MKLLSKNSNYFIKFIGILLLFFPGCSSQSYNLVTVSEPEFNKEEIKKIGIIKFKNQSIDPDAGLKVADIFYKELTSYRQFELVAPAEMSHKGYKMEFVKTPEDIPGLPSPVDKIKNPEINPESKSNKEVKEIPVLDAVVTGVITRYNDKEGSPIAVKKPASVSFKIFLIRVKDNKILWSANFAETQEALSDNLLLADRFKKAGGVWLTSDALTQLGMQKIIKAFPGLNPEGVKAITK